MASSVFRRPAGFALGPAFLALVGCGGRVLDAEEGARDATVLEDWQRDLRIDARGPAGAAWDGANVFGFAESISWNANLPYNPMCHTSFSELHTTVAGTMTCRNLLGGDGQTLKDVTVQFFCVLTP